MAYIYMIENKLNSKKYIGKTNFSIEKRFKEHISDAKKGNFKNRPLYYAISKYGKENFSIRVLEEVENKNANEREVYWIAKYDTYKTGYNATLGGEGTTVLDYAKILSLYDNTLLSKREIAKRCNCSVDSVFNIVLEYRQKSDWSERYILSDNSNRNLVNQPLKVRCIETGREFPSATQAANWLIEEGRINSQVYGRNKIPEVCRGTRKTVGGYRWERVE